jgi:hypothetical protein
MSLVGSGTAASTQRVQATTHVAYVTKVGSHRWRRISVLYCLTDHRTEFCVGTNGRMYKIVRRIPGEIFLRPIQQ